MAVDAGFIEYPSLPGSIKTGCIRTPKFKARFCDEHLPRTPIHKPQYLTKDDIEKAEPVSSENHIPLSEGQVVELLLQKRTTRSDVYYQVLATCICDMCMNCLSDLSFPLLYV